MKFKKLLLSLTLLITSVSQILPMGTPAGTSISNGGDAGVQNVVDASGDTIVSMLSSAGTTLYYTCSSVSVTVSSGYAISLLNTPPDQNLPPGSTAYYSYGVCNLANTSDIFHIFLTTTTGESWTAKIFRDNNFDGVYQNNETTEITSTGVLLPDTTFYFIVAVIIPKDASPGLSSSWQLTVKNQNGTGSEDNWPTTGNDTIRDDFTTKVIKTIDTVKPNPPAGVKAVRENNNFIRIFWSEVTRNTDGSPADDISGYRIYKSTTQLSSNKWFMKAQVSSYTYSWLDQIGESISYYRVSALDFNNNESGPSMIVDSSVETRTIAVCEENGGILATLEIPHKSAEILHGSRNNLGVDITFKLMRIPSDEKSSDIKVVEFTPVRSDTSESIPGKFKFEVPVEIKFYYDVNNDNLVDNIGFPVENVDGNLAIFYYNGVEWVKYGGRIDKVEKCVSIKTAHLSKYKLSQSVSKRIQLTITPRKIFSPDDKNDEFNKIRFNIVNPNNDRFTGKIYDLNGGIICDMKNETGSTDNPCILYWDGKNSKGDYVPSGVYIYQIEGGKTINGTVVVVR